MPTPDSTVVIVAPPSVEQGSVRGEGVTGLSGMSISNADMESLTRFFNWLNGDPDGIIEEAAASSLDFDTLSVFFLLANILSCLQHDNQYMDNRR